MDKYKDKLARKEKELLADMRLMGEEGIEAMKNRVRQKVYFKLLDEEEEWL